jgi:hypothetical protein
VLFGGSRRFTSSAASSTRSRPSHAIGVVSLVHTRVVAAGSDPEPHSGRCSMPNSSSKDSGVRRIVSRRRELLQPDDGVPMELRDDAAGEASTASRSAGECQELEPNRESSAARTASPRSRRARMSGARRSERLRTANRRTSSSTMPFAAAMSSHRWAAPSATVARSPSIPPGGGRRPNPLSCLAGTGSEAH